MKKTPACVSSVLMAKKLKMMTMMVPAPTPISVVHLCLSMDCISFKSNPSFDRELTGTIDLTLQTTENLPLTDAVSSVTLGTEADVEIFTLDVTAGSTFQLTVRAMNPDDTTRVNVIGPDGWAVHTLSIDGASMGIMEFTAETSGTLSVELDPFFFDDTASFEISIVPAG